MGVESDGVWRAMGVKSARWKSDRCEERWGGEWPVEERPLRAASSGGELWALAPEGDREHLGCVISEPHHVVVLSAGWRFASSGRISGPQEPQARKSCQAPLRSQIFITC